MKGLIWGVVALGLLLALLAAPVVTWHGLAVGAGRLDRLDLEACTDVRLLLLLSVGLAGVIQVARSAMVLVDFLGARRTLNSLQAVSEARQIAGITYRAIPLEAVTFFTAGVRTPRIFASTAAERALPPAVFHAALLHELAHCRHGDVLRNHILGLIDGAGGWLPGVNGALHAIRLRVEHAADNDAIAAGASRRDLFEAIVSVCDPSVPGAVAMSEGDVMPRLEYLAGTPWAPRGVTWLAPISVGLWSAVLPVAAHLLAIIGFTCFTSAG